MSSEISSIKLKCFYFVSRSAFLLTVLVISSSVYCREVSFDPDFLVLSDGKNSKNTDLSYFSSEGGFLPGEYKVQVLVNHERVGNETLNFVSPGSGKGTPSPCVTSAQLLRLGITPPERDDQVCFNLDSSLYQGVTGIMDLNKMVYSLEIPQLYLLRNDWLKTDPSQWQDGIPALMVNYNFSGNRQGVYVKESNSNNSEFLSLDSLANVMGWRLYNSSNWIRGDDSSDFSSLRTYVQKNYGFGQGGEMTLGDNYINADFFDSFQFKGIKMESDDGMIQPALVDYSPAVRGIAYSQARVTVRQNGQIIYERNVPAGPFEFTDLSAYTGGDLDITVREADGTERHFTQTSANLPVLQRQGRLKYSLSAGRYDSYARSEEPFFTHLTTAYGLADEYTLYAGTILSSPYRAYLIGLGKYNNILGAFAVDTTWSDASVKPYSNAESKRTTGQSYRFSYARGFSTGTALNLAAYRYSTKGFYTFEDSMARGREYESNTLSYRIKSRFVVSLSQPLGDFGQLGISGSQDEYWASENKGSSWMASWNNTLHSVSINLSLGYSQSTAYRDDKTATLGFSVPLSSYLNGNQLSVSNTTSSLNGHVTNQTMVSGLTKDSNLSWNVSNSLSGSDNGSSQSGSIMLNGSKGQIAAGYTRYRDADVLNYGVRGGLALHSSGLTMSQALSLNGGNALVDTNGVSDVPVQYGNGIKTDIFGYAIVPNLTAFQKENISLDINEINTNTEALDTDKMIIPARGALIPVNFNVISGKRAVFVINRKGEYLPLGTIVSVSSNDHSVSGIVGDGGQAYMSGLPSEGIIESSNGTGFICRAPYKLDSDNLQIINLNCQ